MSADNWTTCPRCLDAATKAAVAEHERVMGLYGSVSVEEFDRLRADLTKVDEEDYRTFREDYEFYGASTGTVTSSYSGTCTQCGLTVELNAAKPFWPEREASTR